MTCQQGLLPHRDVNQSSKAYAGARSRPTPSRYFPSTTKEGIKVGEHVQHVAVPVYEWVVSGTIRAHLGQEFPYRPLHATHTSLCLYPPSPFTRFNPANSVEKEKPPIIDGDDDWKPTTGDLSHSKSGVLILLYTSWQGLSCLFKLNTHRFIALPLHTSEIPS